MKDLYELENEMNAEIDEAIRPIEEAWVPVLLEARARRLAREQEWLDQRYAYEHPWEKREADRKRIEL